jgi:hypothetical protein
VLKVAGVLAVEEYIERRRETIMKYTQNEDYIWEVQKIPKDR